MFVLVNSYNQQKRESMYMHVCVCVCVCVHVHVYVRVHVYLRMCVCVYVGVQVHQLSGAYALSLVITALGPNLGTLELFGFYSMCLCPLPSPDQHLHADHPRQLISGQHRQPSREVRVKCKWEQVLRGRVSEECVRKIREID